MRHLACSLLALSLVACQDKASETAQGNAPEAAAPTERLALDTAGLPTFRAGLWEVVKTSSDEAGETTQECIGAEANAQLREMLTRDGGPDCKVERSNTIFSQKVRADCAQAGGLRTDTTFEVSGSETRYTMKLAMYVVKPDGTGDGGEEVAKARWIGACPAGVKPGEEVGGEASEG